MQSPSAFTTAQIRTQVRKLRRDLSPQQRLSAQQSIYQQIQHHPKVAKANHIAIFLSFDGELETKPIIEYLWQQNKAVYLPRIHPFHHHSLLFIRYHPQTKLNINQFGIAEPKLNVNEVIPYQKLDLIFTPLVAFDQRNYRIGMGGGYYDRLLANQNLTRTYPIGLAFACQKLDHLPNQPWDIQLPEIITA
ncbi:5-formyltetrahydrofolate cyclo-ligase [Orbus hercynius]|uniref:5-formyltetrahydrofolate cyclo-ligase n=1 Tax=Orbus hercynius TaxID=593135 RepID=A0A495RCK0_9GAMM|nr:5-formyltetrahydrofolate cyclo-ligase [Orbus hercynius]RKS85193.1 5-formyltetrahydrofolate cyclo-ligase [Orbus hercynius]